MAEPRAWTCEQCGTITMSTRRRRFCSRTCEQRRRHEANPRRCEIPDCDTPHYARGMCHPHYRKAYPTKRGKHRPHTMQCVVCHTTYTRSRRSRQQPCCSTQCRNFLLGKGPRTELPADHWARWYGATSDWTPPPPKPARFISARCAGCGQWFVSDMYRRRGRDHAIYCTRKCKSHAAGDRRRARKSDAYVADVWRHKVYESDGWRCHICGKKVRRTATVPHPMAPTIDHVIPLADGGTHEPANCRTAHFMCNSVKGNRGGGEQMLLIAV